MNATIQPVASADLPQVVQLLNSAYRGEEARKGWTHESDLIDGEVRTDEGYLQNLLADPSATMLAYKRDGVIIGSVYLHQRDNTLYLGMLSVSPQSQGSGIGKQLLKAADDYARRKHCPSITITVISTRHELVAWYQRHGYEPTGATLPFQEEQRFGIPRQQLEFIIMRKEITDRYGFESRIGKDLKKDDTD